MFSLTTASFGSVIPPATGFLVSDLKTNAELTTSDLRHADKLSPSTALQNLKIGWSTKMDYSKIGWTSTLKTTYDFKANRHFLKDATMTGEFDPSTLDGPEKYAPKFGYELRQNFADSKFGVGLKLASPAVGGVALATEYDTAAYDNLKSVSMPGAWKVAPKVTLAACTEWLVGANAMRYVGAVNAWDSKLKATISHRVKESGPPLNYEVKAEQAIGEGRALSATLASSGPKPKALAFEYTDSETDSAGTWIVNAALPLDRGAKDVFRQPAINVKRAWSF